MVELTVALHYVFDTPRDRIIWDVGHQTSSTQDSEPAAATAYARCARGGGLSGFTKRLESEYDCPLAPVIVDLDIGGPRTAIARDLEGGDNHVTGDRRQLDVGRHGR